MGSKSTDSSGGSSQQTQYTATPEERELNKLQLEQMRAADPFMRDAQRSGLQRVTQLLEGDADLPGFLKTLPGGISPEVTSSIVQESLRDIAPSFQQSGLMDSGVRASVSARTAGDIRRASEEFNIGNKLNLLNLALSGQAQVQAPILGVSGQLGGRLAGLRTVNQTGAFNQTSTSRSSFFGEGGVGQSLIGAGGAALGGYLSCWVAAELYGGYFTEPVDNCKKFIHELGPKWFKKLYDKYSFKVALFISNKPMLKKLIKPLFDWFAKKGKEAL